MSNQICKLCKQEEHSSECPQGHIQNLHEWRERYNCPKCGAEITVELNKIDLFECRDCKTQFSLIYSTSKEVERAVLQRCMGVEEEGDHPYPLTVIVLSFKGSGEFRFDRALEILTEEVREWERSHR